MKKFIFAPSHSLSLGLSWAIGTTNYRANRKDENVKFKFQKHLLTVKIFHTKVIISLSYMLSFSYFLFIYIYFFLFTLFLPLLFLFSYRIFSHHLLSHFLILSYSILALILSFLSFSLLSLFAFISTYQFFLSYSFPPPLKTIKRLGERQNKIENISRVSIQTDAHYFSSTRLGFFIE